MTTSITFPITIEPKDIVFPDGKKATIPPFELNELNVAFIDRPSDRTVSVKILPFPKEIVLWEGEEYDDIGDWTQAQADKSLSARLGENPKAVLEALF